MREEDILRPIGVFDSGVGGISVLADLIEWMPNERFIYFGDTKNAPYGIRSKGEVREFAMSACEYLMERDVKAIVVACNTATSAAIGDLRKAFPIPVVGMEPALKVAVDARPKGKILVMATPMTLKETKFVELLDRFSANHDIESIPAPILVELVENGFFEGESVEAAIRDYLGDLPQRGLSTIVLGCTHFVFLEETLKRLYRDIDIIDGNKGTARHLMNLLMGRNLLNQESLDEVEVDLCTSSEDPQMIETFKEFLTYRIEGLMNKRRRQETEKELEERILEEIRLVLDQNQGLADMEKKLIRHRYGIQREKITEMDRLAREFNLPKAKIEAMMEKAERKLFNLIKERI